jgi:hypothetical protein
VEPLEEHWQAARDRAIARLNELREVDEWKRWQQRVTNLAKREELCVRVEALVDSTDWKETGALIKALQQEWKAIGPAPRSQAEPLWQRFRAACDQFFARRQQHDLAVRDQERQGNLKAKLLLCERMEALYAADDIAAAQETARQLQVEWKTVGPTPRDQSDAVWTRFRTASDQLFARSVVPEPAVATGYAAPKLGDLLKE